MSDRRYVYLAGPIAGLSYDFAKNGWREFLVEALDERYGASIKVLSPMRQKEYLEGIMELAHDPGVRNTKQIMARDFSDIERADLVVVGLHENPERVSIGTMIELGYAKKAGKPILVIVNEETGLGIHDHGWVKELADIWAVGVPEAADQIVAFCSEGL